MKKYISYGAGVGSTALICYMINEIRNNDIEIVFCNHLGDWPETYDYIKYIQSKLNIKITVLNVEIEDGIDGLYDYYIKHNTIPFYHYKICTDKAKIRPFNKYIIRPCSIYLGITWDERKRAQPNKLKTIKNLYPFVDIRTTRKKAIEIIKEHDLKIPNKSGCYFCPFQRKIEWKRLYDEHNDLFIKSIKLEENAGRHILPSGKSLQSLYDEFKYQKILSDYK